MAVTINASTTTGLVQSADTSGIIQLQSNGTTAVTIDTSQNVIVNGTTALNSAANRGNITIRGSSSRIVNFGNASAETGYIVSDSGGLEIRNVENLPMIFSTNNTERMRIDSSGNLLFNSGYGSVATAYGCRAWVNFNGTGTVAIRASGNVSSITDIGTGDYTVNFTTAMPDANYGFACCGSQNESPSYTAIPIGAAPANSSSLRVTFRNTSNTVTDPLQAGVSIFR